MFSTLVTCSPLYLSSRYWWLLLYHYYCHEFDLKLLNGFNMFRFMILLLISLPPVPCLVFPKVQAYPHSFLSYSLRTLPHEFFIVSGYSFFAIKLFLRINSTSYCVLLQVDVWLIGANLSALPSIFRNVPSYDFLSSSGSHYIHLLIISQYNLQKIPYTSWVLRMPPVIISMSLKTLQ